MGEGAVYHKCAPGRIAIYNGWPQSQKYMGNTNWNLIKKQILSREEVSQEFESD